MIAGARPSVVIIATAGRPDICAEAVRAIDEAAHSPEVTIRGIVSAPDQKDAPNNLTSRWALLLGPRGSAAQRNTALDSVGEETEYVFFFDDDAIPRSDYIVATSRYLEEKPAVLAVTGNVIADGAATGREIPLVQALQLLDESWETTPGWNAYPALPSKDLYGCNFAIRWSALRDVRFDERLPLYSWLEDRDYACRAARIGEIRRLEGAIVVHRGSASGGRTAHRRLGYSQVANPWWLAEKGSFSWRLAAQQIARPVLKNMILSIVPAKRLAVRRSRLAGNLNAFVDLTVNHGRAQPEKILEMS